METTTGLVVSSVSDVCAARRVALETAGQMLASSNGHFWNGGPWCMWVTDQPHGGGTTLFTLIPPPAAMPGQP